MKQNLRLVLIVLTTLTFAAGSLAAASGSGSFTEADSWSAPILPSSPSKVAIPTKAASVTFFNNQAAFSAAAPGLTLEDFENGPGPGQLVGCPSPLSSASSGACYPAGELVDGFSFSTDQGQVVALGAGIVPVNPTTWIAADLFSSGSSLEFSGSDVFAVGFELFSFAGAPITVSVFGNGGALLGTAIHPVGATFFGVKVDETITRVSVNGGPVSAFDNLQFGKGVIDTDGDGIADDEDACPNSDLSPTVVIDGCDSGVGNTLGADGCTISDLVGMCADGAGNHGSYVRCVAHLTNDLKKAGIITGAEKGAINSCAARADLP